MPQSSTVAARCAALGTSIGQVIPDILGFARKVRDSRHDLNEINHNLLVVRTGLAVAQDDFSAAGSHLPISVVDAVSRIIDSCDDTSERLHKSFLKLSCSNSPKHDWQIFKDGALVNLRHDLDASKVVLELALDYIALFGQQDTLDVVLQGYVSQLITASDDLLKRTDSEEIYVNQTAREGLSSLLQAIKQLRSCITAISRDGTTFDTQPQRRTSTPRPDSLEPSLGEESRSGRKSPPKQLPASSSASKGIGKWLANVPSFEDDGESVASIPSRKLSTVKLPARPSSRSNMTPSRGTFYTDDGVSSGRTLVPPESRLRKSRSWCSDISKTTVSAFKVAAKKATSKNSVPYSPTISNSDVSIFHKRITSDKIAVTQNNRKDLDTNQRMAFDRILANVPADATANEVERILWEGASSMAPHPEFGYFFIRAAYKMSIDVLKALVDFGADISRTSDVHEHYRSAMHAAAAGGQFSIVKYLTSLGHSIDSTNKLLETPLHLAIKAPKPHAIAKHLLDAGADVNHETANGQTPLQITLKNTRLEGKERSMLIELLLAHGADGEVNEVMEAKSGNSKGRSVLGLA
ncbi:hypothetical protein ACN47E_009302 [Coniothyrium glycines]